jgi:hypothetical protein
MKIHIIEAKVHLIPINFQINLFKFPVFKVLVFNQSVIHIFRILIIISLKRILIKNKTKIILLILIICFPLKINILSIKVKLTFPRLLQKIKFNLKVIRHLLIKIIIIKTILLTPIISSEKKKNKKFLYKIKLLNKLNKYKLI